MGVIVIELVLARADGFTPVKLGTVFNPLATNPVVVLLFSQE
jgi:hypothetical protein